MQKLGKEIGKGFDLAEGNVYRFVVVKVGEDDHIAFLTMHHIVFDGWSTAIIVKEIGELYRAFLNENNPNLPDLDIQYGDFAYWQRNWLKDDVLQNQLKFWKEKLKGIPSFLNLPTDKPRPKVQTINGAVETVQFDPELVSNLKELSRNESVTLFMVLMAGLRTILHKYTGDKDIVIGTPVAGRTHRETESLIGCFINTLGIRSSVDSQMEFSDILQAEREESLQAFSNQDVPFEKIVEELNPDRNLGHTPIFQVMMTLQNMSIGALELDDLKMSRVDIPSSGARYDLAFWLVEVDGKINCSVEYNSDLFEAESIQTLLRFYNTLLKQIVAEPDIKISDIDLLRGTEEEKALERWNENDHNFDENVFIHEKIKDIGLELPQKDAVISGDKNITYQQLDLESDKIAAYLQLNNIGKEDRVGILFDRSAEVMVCILGIMKAGAAYVPLDADYPAERLRFMSENADVKLIIKQKDLHASKKLENTTFINYEEIKDFENEFDTKIELNSENLAYMIFTSGSTGKPKGTMVSHKNLMHSTNARPVFYENKPGNYLLLSSFSQRSLIIRNVRRILKCDESSSELCLWWIAVW